MPALVNTVLVRTTHKERIVLSDMIQAAGATIVVAASNAACLLGLRLILVAPAPGGERSGIGTLAYDSECEDCDGEERECLIEGHLL